MQRFPWFSRRPAQSGISLRRLVVITTVVLLLVLASPALAHHAMGRVTPQTSWQGFLSGLAHPLIGIDHAAGIVAVGLLAATQPRGAILPLGFALTALVGTGLHLAGVNLPGVELAIAASLGLVGVGLGLGDGRPRLLWGGLATLVGLGHGYAYGEAIVGAEPQALGAYLIGFTLTQACIGLMAFSLGRMALPQPALTPLPLRLRIAGGVLGGIGLSLLYSQLVQLVLPVMPS
ncbi:MAG: HupE/UreJ family protein [Nodosilinea sp.]